MGFVMQLSDWLSQNRIKRKDFAARIGVSPQTITGWCKGTFWIKHDQAKAVHVVKETGRLRGYADRFP
jgi:uncharacterized protein YjcR